jgi:hypothetical protein
MTGSFAIDALLFLIAMVAPGVAVAWVFLGARDALRLTTIGAVLGLFFIPFVAFAAAMLLRTHMSGGLILAVSAAVALPTVGWGMILHKRQSGGEHP